MSSRMLAALRLLRQDLASHLDRDAVDRLCRDLGHRWRRRLLDPVAVLHLFILQVLHGNTALTHLRHLVARDVSASAICQARARLPLDLFQAVLRGVNSTLGRQASPDGRWLGHRTLLIDGSSFSMPDTPDLQRHFGQSRKAKPGCGFPVAHLMALFDAGTGLLLEAFAAPLHSHDLGLAWRLHPRFEPGDVLVADRGFCSFAHLAALARDGFHAVFRLHQRQIVDFTPNRPHVDPRRAEASPRGRPRSRWIRAVGLNDQIVAWIKPRMPPRGMASETFAALPDSIVVRELRYRVETSGFRSREITLVTTLIDEATYSAPALAALYFRRWEVETHLRELKQTMRMDVLRCQTVAGVTKELTVYALVYNLVRAVMLEAARRQGVVVERISFFDAMCWLAHAIPGDPMPELIVNPLRPGRVEPRSIKRRPKQYPWMSSPRKIMRKRLIEKKLAS
jgi:hypothetical protein